MAFLDSLKKKKGYATILAAGIAVLLINSWFDFLDKVLRNKELLLLSVVTFIITRLFIEMNKEEVLK